MEDYAKDARRTPFLKKEMPICYFLKLKNSARPLDRGITLNFLEVWKVSIKTNDLILQI